jgi:Zn-dependent protease
LGHTFAFRYFGISSHIVLYHFGGLAIPDGHSRAWSSSMRQDDPRASIIISAAGPGVQMVSALAMILAVNLAGYSVDLDPISRMMVPAQTGEAIPNPVFRFFMLQYCFISIYWALVNLLPVFPLDGGNIARNLMRMFSNPATAVPNSLMLSVGVAGAMAVWGLSQGSTFLAIMFGLLGYSSYQQLQMFQGPRRW